tara:strand:- start:1449 stop:1820 length:372 start_codon:yes stop_codon:yes gene_type:complete
MYRTVWLILLLTIPLGVQANETLTLNQILDLFDEATLQIEKGLEKLEKGLVTVEAGLEKSEKGLEKSEKAQANSDAHVQRLETTLLAQAVDLEAAQTERTVMGIGLIAISAVAVVATVIAIVK